MISILQQTVLFSQKTLCKVILASEEKPIPSAFGHVSMKNWTGEELLMKCILWVQDYKDDTAQLKIYVSKDMVEHEYAKLKKKNTSRLTFHFYLFVCH